MKQTKDLELSIYYDAYGDMLTSKQSEIFELYYNEDLSLAEIASMQKTSRQAVADSLMRAKKKLHELEDGLGLVQQRKC